MIAERVIAGNWKMHMGPAAGREFVEAFRPPAGTDARRIVLFPPALTLSAVRAAVDGSPLEGIDLGVQNVHWEREGAFTGEISAGMAREAGATWALVGHSERRHVFGETDEEVARKVVSIREAGMMPLVCVGETLEERREGRLEEVLHRQLGAVLDPAAASASGEGGSPELRVAYEPVWAIGTGETATPDDASAAHAFLRSILEVRFGGSEAAGISILYGGSVKPDNAQELLAAPGVDGVLVGGASLDPVSFARIAAAG